MSSLARSFAIKIMVGIGRVAALTLIAAVLSPSLHGGVGGLPVGGVGAEKAVLTRVAIFRGRDKMVWVNLKNLLSGKELALNIRLQRNDVVYLPDGDDQLVYVMGEVARPGRSNC